MKKILLALSLAFSVSSFASEAKIIAEIPAEVNSKGYVIIQLTDQKIAVITHYEYVETDPYHFSEIIVERRDVLLHDALYQELLSRVIILSNAKLQETEDDVVCSEALSKGPSEDLRVRRGFSEEDGFSSGDQKLALVYDQRGCWASKHTKPEQKSDRDIAKKLIKRLQMLGY